MFHSMLLNSAFKSNFMKLLYAASIYTSSNLYFYMIIALIMLNTTMSKLKNILFNSLCYLLYT